MKDENIIFKKNKNKNVLFKMNLLNFLIIKQPENINNWQNFNLISNYEEIKILLNNYINSKHLTKILYFNKIENILYEADEIIEIKSDNEELMGLSFYFYLSILIENNPIIINYIYSIHLIKSLNMQRTINNNIFKKLIISKILLILINNYRESDYYEEKDNNELELMEKEAKKDILEITQENKNIFENINLNKKIDGIYIDIILNLIKSQNFFEKYDDILNILNELDLENINMTNFMFKKLSTFLSDEDNIKDYIISQLDDLFNNKKLSLYFVLFKYLIKNILYVFQIKFLYETRKTIIKLIKNKNQFLIKYHKSNNVIKNKLKLILKSFIDFDYYFNLLNSNDDIIECTKQQNPQTKNPLNEFIIEKNENIGNYHIIQNDSFTFNPIEDENNNELSDYNFDNSNIFCNSTYKIQKNNSNRSSDIISDDNSTLEINKLDINSLTQLLRNSSFKFHIDKKNIIYDEIKIDGKKIKNINIIKEAKFFNLDSNIERNFKKFRLILDNIENTIQKELYKDKLEYTLEFKKIEDINHNENTNYYYIDCKYLVEASKSNNITVVFNDKNILNNRDLSGLKDMINKLTIVNYNKLE